MIAAPAIMAAPFLLGFGPAATVITVGLGALLLGLALQVEGPQRSDAALGSRRVRLRARDRGGGRRPRDRRWSPMSGSQESFWSASASQWSR